MGRRGREGVHDGSARGQFISSGFVVCFCGSEAWQDPPMRDGRSSWWVVDKGQQGTKNAYTGYGETRPRGTFRIPLRTIEADDEFDKTPSRERKTRYFERK